MNYRLKILFLLAVFIIVASWQTYADIVIIVHRENPLKHLTKNQVSDLYMGLTHYDAEENTSVFLYEFPDNSLRETFFQILNGMNIKQVNTYWARLQFSGQVLPPVRLPDSQAVLEAVSHNRNAMGYIDASLVNDSVKILLRLKK